MHAPRRATAVAARASRTTGPGARMAAGRGARGAGNAALTGPPGTWRARSDRCIRKRARVVSTRGASRSPAQGSFDSAAAPRDPRVGRFDLMTPPKTRARVFWTRRRILPYPCTGLFDPATHPPVPTRGSFGPGGASSGTRARVSWTRRRILRYPCTSLSDPSTPPGDPYTSLSDPSTPRGDPRTALLDPAAHPRVPVHGSLDPAAVPARVFSTRRHIPAGPHAAPFRHRRTRRAVPRPIPPCRCRRLAPCAMPRTLPHINAGPHRRRGAPTTP